MWSSVTADLSMEQWSIFLVLSVIPSSHPCPQQTSYTVGSLQKVKLRSVLAVTFRNSFNNQDTT